jgi:hypothetical protein
MYLNNLDQHKSITLQKTQIVAFGKYPDQKGIFGIEIEIKGQSKSNVDLLISDIEGLKHGASVKGKNLDFVYKNDWYSDSCYIRILPRGEVDGKLDIHCRFLATD